MLQKLANHNDDLRRLLEKGYACAVDGGHLVVRDIPYLNDQGALQWGAFVVDLEFVDKERVKQKNHQLYFTGAVPCGLDGKPIPWLGRKDATLPLGDSSKDIVVNCILSHKIKKKDGQVNGRKSAHAVLAVNGCL